MPYKQFNNLIINVLHCAPCSPHRLPKRLTVILSVSLSSRAPAKDLCGSPAELRVSKVGTAWTSFEQFGHKLYRKHAFLHKNNTAWPSLGHFMAKHSIPIRSML